MNEKDQEIDETQSEDVEVATPGQLLKEAREASQLSVEDISSKLHLKISLIEAIEKNNFDEISSITFARGYLKAYAKLLDVNEADILAAFEHYITAERQQTEMQTFSNRKGKKKLDSWLTILTLLLLVGIIAAVAVWYVRNQPEAVEPAADNTTIAAQQGNVTSNSSELDDSQTTQLEPQVNQDNLSPAGELLEPEPTVAELSVTEQVEAPIQAIEQETTQLQEPQLQEPQQQEPNAEQSQQQIQQTEVVHSGVVESEAAQSEQAEGSVNQAEGSFGQVEGSVNQAEGSVNQAEGSVDQAEGSVNQAEGSVDQAEGSVNQAEGSINESVQDDGAEQQEVATAHLELRFEDSCWINIEDATGERVAIGTKVKGHYTSVRGVPPFTIKLGKPDAVSIWLDGQPREIPYYPKGSIANFELAAN